MQTITMAALPDSAFALPSKRKFPINDANHAVNAMARLEQQKGALSSAEYATAKSNIQRAYKRFGIKPGKPGRNGTHASIRTKGLTIHVHHMSDRGVTATGERMCRAVELGAAPEGDGPVWNQIAKVGQWAGHSAGPFQITAEEIRQMIANFLATTNRAIPVDFEHASEADPTNGSIPTEGAPAQGWITELQDRGAEGLWGLFDWLEPARTYVKERKYKFLSPAIRFGSKDRLTGKSVGARLTSVAMTNNPFLDGMAPLAASDREGSTTMNYAFSANEYMPQLRSAMKMGDTTTAHECLDRLKQLEDLYASAGGQLCVHQGVDLADFLPAMRDTMRLPLSSSYEHIFEAIRELLHAADGDIDDDDEDSVSSRDMRNTTMSADEITTKLRDAEAKIATFSARDVELTVKASTAEAKAVAAETTVAQLGLTLKDVQGSLSEAIAKLAAKDAEIKSLKDAEEKRGAEEQERRVTEAFDTYKDRKSLTDADKVAMRIVLKSDSATFETLYPRVAPGQQHLLRNMVSGQREPQNQQATPTQPARPRTSGGAASSQDEFRALKDKFIKEGMPFQEAILRANKELRERA